MIKEAYAVSIEENFGFGRLANGRLSGFDFTLGAFVQLLVPLAFSIAAIMIVFYFIIGAFEMITSQGDKAHIVSARSKIYHSLIGFVLLIILFLVIEYIIPAILRQSQTNPLFRII